MISFLTACELERRSYDPALLENGSLPYLEDLGFRAKVGLYGKEPAPICFGFLAEAIDGTDQAVVNRGTKNKPEWLIDAEIRLQPNPWGPGDVHDGFSDLVETFGWGSGFEPLELMLTDPKQITLIGHSLGAAAQRLLSMRLAKMLGSPVASVITWGEPRSCCKEAAAHALTCAELSSRRVNACDPVTHMPHVDPLDPLDPYFHAGPEVRLGSWGDPVFNASECHSIDNYAAQERLIAGGPST